MTDYETDPRSFADCLKDFAAKVNGGDPYGSRVKAAAELRTSDKNIHHWMDGRSCAAEATMRRLMTMIIAAR